MVRLFGTDRSCAPNYHRNERLDIGASIGFANGTFGLHWLCAEQEAAKSETAFNKCIAIGVMPPKCRGKLIC